MHEDCGRTGSTLCLVEHCVANSAGISIFPISDYSPSRRRKVAKGVEKPAFQEYLTIPNVLTQVKRMTMLAAAIVAACDVMETIQFDHRLN